MINWLWGATCMLVCFVVLSDSPWRYLFLIIGLVDVVMANIEYTKLKRRVEMLEDMDKFQDAFNSEVVMILDNNNVNWKKLIHILEDEAK